MKRLMAAGMLVGLVWSGCGKKNESSETPQKATAVAADEGQAGSADRGAPDEARPDEAKPDELEPDEVKPDEAEPGVKVIGLARVGEKSSHAITMPLEGDVEIAIKVESDGKSASVLSRAVGKWAEFGPHEVKQPMRFDAILDGRDLYILALKLDKSGAVEWTTATRYRFDSKNKMSEAGGFEGEGLVDYQTIDLDEE